METETKARQTAPHPVRKGPMEGVVLVDGRPQREAADMPVFSFENIQATTQYNKKHPEG